MKAIKDYSFKVLLEKQDVNEFFFGSDLAAKVKNYKISKMWPRKLLLLNLKRNNFYHKGQLTLFGITSLRRDITESLDSEEPTFTIK